MSDRHLLWYNLAFLVLLIAVAVAVLLAVIDQKAARDHDRIATICGAYEMTEDDLSEVLACMEDLKQE